MFVILDKKSFKLLERNFHKPSWSHNGTNVRDSRKIQFLYFRMSFFIIDKKSFNYSESMKYTLIARSLVWTYEDNILKSKHIIQLI